MKKLRKIKKEVTIASLMELMGSCGTCGMCSCTCTAPTTGSAFGFDRKYEADYRNYYGTKRSDRKEERHGFCFSVPFLL